MSRGPAKADSVAFVARLKVSAPSDRMIDRIRVVVGAGFLFAILAAAVHMNFAIGASVLIGGLGGAVPYIF